VVAYVAAVLLYMANGDIIIEDTARQYMKQAMGESAAVLAVRGAIMLRSEGCSSCRQRAWDVIWRGRGHWPLKRVAPAPYRADLLPCTSKNCGAFIPLEWPKWRCRVFCSEDCHLHPETKVFVDTVLE
jgi:hypothetical protein